MLLPLFFSNLENDICHLENGCDLRRAFYRPILGHSQIKTKTTYGSCQGHLSTHLLF